VSLAPANDGGDQLVSELSASVAFHARPGQSVAAAITDAMAAQLCLPGDDRWCWEAAAALVEELRDIWRAARSQGCRWATRYPLGTWGEMHARAHEQLLAYAARGGRTLAYGPLKGRA
jgi:hypothetical protein